MPEPLCLVPVLGRGSLALERFRSRPLYDEVAEVARQLGRTVVVAGADGITPSTAVTPPATDLTTVLRLPTEDGLLRRLLAAHDLVVILDPLCPLISAAVVRRVMAAASPAAVGVRPVVDTLKATESGRVTATVDRTQLSVVTSPAVVTAELLVQVDDLAAVLADLAGLTAWLREHATVLCVTVPSVGRRLEDASAVELLRAMDAVGHRLRER